MSAGGGCSSSRDALEVRNLPASGAGAALDPVVVLAQPGLDLRRSLSTVASVAEANSHCPRWRLVFGSNGSSRTRSSVTGSRKYSVVHTHSAFQSPSPS